MDPTDLRIGNDSVQGRQGLIRRIKPYRFTTTYRLRRTKNGVINQRYPYNIPTDRKTAGQLAQREKYKNAVLFWKALTVAEQNAWKKTAQYKGYTGYNACIKNYLLNH